MLTLATKVDAVTVFRSGAQVIRVADLKPQDGAWPSQVRLTGLPLSLDDQSLRVGACYPEGGAGVLTADARIDLDLVTPQVESTSEPDLEPLRSRRRRLKAELDLVREELQRTNAIEPPARAPAVPGQPPPAFQLEPRRVLVQLRQSQLNLLNERDIQISAEMNDLDRRIFEAETAQFQAQAAASKGQLFKAVIVGLRIRPGAQAPSVRLQVSYQVAGARWAPSYTLKFDRDVTMGNLSMRALVCQSSGEDWQDVEISLSTADPTAWNELPELSSRRIGRAQQPPRQTGWRPPPLGTEALFADFDRGPGRPRAEELAPAPAVDSFAYAEPFAAAEIYASADPFGAVADPFVGGSDPFCAPSQAFGSGADPFAASPPDAYSPPMPAPLRTRIAVETEAAPTRAGMLRTSSDKPLLSRAPAPFAMKQAIRPGSAGAGGALPQAKVLPGYGSEWLATVEDVGAGLLAYGLLRMPAADEPGRGKLQQQSALAACLRLWRAQRPDVTFDPSNLIQSALYQAGRALQSQPPGPHRCPGSISGFDYLYGGESRVELPSDSQYHSLPLFTRQLATQLLWVAVPRTSTDVFRQAEVESLPDLALPSGPVDVFVGRDYLLTSQLQDIAPGGKVKLGLGVEQGLKVVRNTTFKESTAGMLGGTLQLRHTIEIELANRMPRELRVEVREAVPVPDSDTDEVKVKVESAEPAWELLDEKVPGSYRWSMRLAGGGKATLKATYLIELSSKLELAGGNRREE